MICTKRFISFRLAMCRSMKWRNPNSVIAAVFLAACTSSGPIGASDQIALSYNGAGDSLFFFILKNRSNQPINFPATGTREKGVMPWNTTMVCSNQASTEASNSPPLGYSDKPDNITVSPQSRLRLSVEKEEFVQKFKNGSCHLKLRLPSGSTIKSNEFLI
jgi:hypothetical protein